MTTFAAPLDADAIERAPSTPAGLAWRRFRKHRLAISGLVMLGLVALMVTLGSMLVGGYCAGLRRDVVGERWANCNDTSRIRQPPSAEHWFGTDSVGRDIFARIIFGGQISLLIGVSAALLEVILGSIVGAVAAYYGGWIDSILMRLTEAMLTIPSLFLLIVASRFFGGSVPDIDLLGRQLNGSVVVIIIVIALTSWMYLARIVRASVLSLRERDFVSAARALGVSDRRIIFTHLLPNTLAPVVVTLTLGVANAILSEAYVSFLGLGVNPAVTATWGNMLEGAYRYLEQAPWLWFFPGVFILLTVLGVNFVGDGLRDALDPSNNKSL
jgi:peptide/nickel transport system permease protein